MHHINRGWALLIGVWYKWKSMPPSSLSVTILHNYDTANKDGLFRCLQYVFTRAGRNRYYVWYVQVQCHSCDMTQIRMSHPRMATLPIRHSYFTADLSRAVWRLCLFITQAPIFGGNIPCWCTWRGASSTIYGSCTRDRHLQRLAVWRCMLVEPSKINRLV